MISPHHLSGTRVTGTLNIDETALNEVLRFSSALAVEIQSHNRVLLRYGVFHAHAMLPAALQLGSSPQLTVTLGSIVVAWGLKAAIHHPYVRVHGRHVTIKLAEVPALEPWRELFVHVKTVELTTNDGVVGVRFMIEIGT